MPLLSVPCSLLHVPPDATRAVLMFQLKKDTQRMVTVAKHCYFMEDLMSACTRAAPHRKPRCDCAIATKI
eukprot:2849320-Amphidinium_carterae.1